MNPEETGWEKRNITDKERVPEIVENYKALGFKVLVTNFDDNNCPSDCTECMKAAPDHCKVIYTQPGGEDSEGLF